jgi:mono/diheme cytochrome c family protein
VSRRCISEIFRVITLVVVLVGLACSNEATAPEDPAVARGRHTYQNVCIACHNGDPNQDGVLGPAIAGSAEELLRAKVLTGTYPPGHTPKRPGSSAMPQFAYLEERIPDLAAYLASVLPKPANQN